MAIYGEVIAMLNAADAEAVCHGNRALFVLLSVTWPLMAAMLGTLNSSGDRDV